MAKKKIEDTGNAEDFVALTVEEENLSVTQETVTDQQKTATDQQETATDQQKTVTDQQKTATDQQKTVTDQQETAEIVKPAKPEKACTEIPDGVKDILKVYNNVPELYVNFKTGGVFDADSKLSTVGDAILFKNPFYHS
jgi:hypothetical protein